MVFSVLTMGDTRFRVRSWFELKHGLTILTILTINLKWITKSWLPFESAVRHCRVIRVGNVPGHLQFSKQLKFTEFTLVWRFICDTFNLKKKSSHKVFHHLMEFAQLSTRFNMFSNDLKACLIFQLLRKLETKRFSHNDNRAVWSQGFFFISFIHVL